MSKGQNKMTKIKLNSVRLSFPSLYRKAVFGGEETKYEGTFLIDKATQADKIAEIEAAIAAVSKEKHKGKTPPADKLCMKDGDDIDYDGYAGCMSIKASSSKRPMVIGTDRAPLTEDDGKPYAGCYVNAIVELWGQDNQFGKRVNANLLAVQFVKDGTPFGDGVTASVDDFDDIDADPDDFM
jgi:co-chaperonin GroES (HSP10)